MEISRYQMFSNETDFTCTVFHWSQDNVSPLTPVSEFLYFHDAYPPFIYLQHPRGWMSTLMPKLLKPMCLSLFFLNLLIIKVCMCAKLLQLCLTLCDAMDWSPPRSSVHGILQARILERVAMPSTRGSSRPRDRAHISYVSCIGRWVLLPLISPRKPYWSLVELEYCVNYFCTAKWMSYTYVLFFIFFSVMVYRRYWI